jgi:hypothetical protein
MLPPSDSESESGDEEGGEKPEKAEKAPAAEQKAPKAGGSNQSRNAGKLPPSGSEEDEDEDGSDEESSDEAPEPAYLSQAAPRKKWVWRVPFPSNRLQQDGCFDF